MNLVLDTNVLVSGLLSPNGPPGRIVDLVTGRHVTLLVDDRILAEYREVLARPKLKINPVFAEAVLDVIAREAILISAPPMPLQLPDPDDLAFLEVAHAAGAAFLVTGNERHYHPVWGTHAIQVVSPAAFLSFWRSRPGLV